MIFYAIRHKASGELMPQMKRGRGYTHWNPATMKGYVNDQVFQALDVPRLFSTLGKANRCASVWASQPNLQMKLDGYDSFGPDYSLDIKDDKRKKEDVEIVVLHVRIANENTPDN